ncbi:MAG: ABC transporter permease [Kiritimatiellia bacterium]
MFDKMSKHRFLFEELVKRDFKKKYKGTVLGMGWSVLSPLLTLLVMKIVFENFFGRGMAHYTTYLFCGNLVFSWFSEATNLGMRSLLANAPIFTKVDVPKYIFILSGSVQTLINFALTLCVFFLFCALDDIAFDWRLLLLAFPVLTLFLFNLGVGLVLSALHVFFRDMDYLWRVFLMLLMYGSAIFYPVSVLSPKLRLVFAFNPVYRHIEYFRLVVLDGVIPPWETHLTLAAFAALVLLIGGWMYKRYNTKFLYYV